MNYAATTLHLENGTTENGFYLARVEAESDEEITLTLQEEIDAASLAREGKFLGEGDSFSVALTPADAVLLGESLIALAKRMTAI